MVLIISITLLFFSLFCTAQIGIRYILPIFPFVCVFLGKSNRLLQRATAIPANLHRFGIGMVRDFIVVFSSPLSR